LFDSAYAAQILPLLVRASAVTLQAWAVAVVVAAILGLLIAIARLSPVRAFSSVAAFYVAFVRGTPLLVQIYFLYFVLPDFGLTLDAFVTGVMAIGLHGSAYTAEIYRALIQRVPRGQWEAATALNMPTGTTWRRIILPQAVPPAVPMLGNLFIFMIKDTPQLSTIGVIELMGEALRQASLSYRFAEPLLLVGAIFILMSVATAGAIRRLETLVPTR
jgi:polar amino acid transport system permease protein